MPPLKVVFDTNIYVMAAGASSGYVDYWLELACPPGNKFQLFTSPAILVELQSKLENRLDMPRYLAVEYIEQIEHLATVVSPKQRLDVIKHDPDDNKILECAQEAGADIIVSADKDLLKLKTYKGIQIHHPTNLRYIFSYLDTDPPE